MSEQKAPRPDPEQLALDLEDARLRLARFREAVLKKEAAETEVRRLTAELARAKRRLREAGYDLVLVASESKRGDRRQ